MNKRDPSIGTHFYYVDGENPEDVPPARCKYCGCPVKNQLDSLRNHLNSCEVFRDVSNEDTKEKTTLLYNNLVSRVIVDETETDYIPPLNLGLVSNGDNLQEIYYHVSAVQQTWMANLECGAFSLLQVESGRIGSSLGVLPSRCYADIQTMCLKEKNRKDSRGMDCVIILTPVNSHYFMVLEALENGYHVLCKSPLCTTELEAATLKKAADVKGLVFHVINPFCYYSMTCLARRIVQDYLLGEILFVRIEYLQHANLDQTHSASSIDTSPFEGGVSDCTANLGIPAYELMRFILDKPVYRLMARFSKLQEDRLLDDSSFITMELEGGAYASMCLSKTSIGHVDHFRIEIEGTNGSVSWCNEQSEELRVQLLDGPCDIIRADTANEEYQGINLREYCSPVSGTSERGRRNPRISSSEGICNMYTAFFGDIQKCVQGKPRDKNHVDIAQALESMLFLSCCVTSNLHMGSWVEMVATDSFQTL